MYFNFSNPFMIGLLIFLVIENINAVWMKPGGLLALVISIPGILVAISFHEFAHAWLADKLGDDTPRRQGRLTLNPLSHIDPFGAILLLFAGFGWGKPVEINPSNFNRKISIKKGNALVSLAGPVMNFILAILFSIIYGIMLAHGSSFLATTTGFVIETAILCTIQLNVGLGVFNLIPLPPLDGSKIILAVLPQKARMWYESHQYILYIVFMVIWLTPIATYIVGLPINAINYGLVNIIKMVAGV